jgi:hypothetical protein
MVCHGDEMSLPSQDASRSKEPEFESLLVNLFRRAGWEVLRQPQVRGADLIIDSGGRKYVVELTRSSEGRRDRLIPLLSQAILQVQAAKQRLPKSAVPVAVVAANRIPDSVAEQLKEFASQHAPDIAVGIIDLEGLRAFKGFGLERFNAERAAPFSLGSLPQSRLPVHLFSDLNQWMLKVLLAPRISESLLSAPRERYQSAAHLARAAGVSVMSASRFVRQLSNEGFLDDRKGRLRLVRIEELLERWRGASHKSLREIYARWIIRGGENQLRSTAGLYTSRMDAKSVPPKHSRRPQRITSPPRICVGLFAAAELLGMGFVRGVAPHLYLERVDAEALKQLGLSLEHAERNPDVQLRIPENKQSIFRPVVRHAGVPVSDIVQTWLDVANHPARGKEQAEQIWKKVLGPALRSEGDEHARRK